MLSTRNILILVICVHLFSLYGYLITTKKGTKTLTQVTKTVEQQLRSRGLKFKNADVYLGTIPKGLAGLTLGIPNIYVYIVLNKEYFENASDEIREALVLHEYTHYLGFRSHVNKYMQKAEFLKQTNELGTFYLYRACPSSIMHESDEVSTCFNKYKDFYYKDAVELIKKGRS